MSAIHSPADYHTHTLLCKHAEGMPADYADQAVRAGLPEIACTDHAPMFMSYDEEHRMHEQDYPRYREACIKAKQETDIPVLYAVEADYFPGCESMLRRWLKHEQYDFVLGSVHYLDYFDFQHPEHRTFWNPQAHSTNWKRYTELVSELAKSGLYDIVAHIDLPKKYGQHPGPEIFEQHLLPMLDAVAASRMAIEINTSGYTHPAGEAYPSLDLLRAANKRNIPIVFGSDAHRPADVGRYFEQAIDLAKQAGYTSYLKFRGREPRSAAL